VFFVEDGVERNTMRHTGLTFVLALLSGAGCYHVGPLDEAFGAPDGGDTDSDTDDEGDTDSELAFYGKVYVRRESGWSSGGSESILLTAEFREWKPETIELTGYLETFSTPDGAICDVFGSMGGVVTPPAPIDGGEIRAGLHGGGDYLSVSFADGWYSQDGRQEGDAEHPMPDWVATDGSTGFFVDGLGSDAVPDFSQLVAFPPPASSMIPPPSGPYVLEAGEDDSFTIAWEPLEDGSPLVVVWFDQDWAQSWFECLPVDEASSIRLPAAKLKEQTDGAAQLMLYSVNGYAVSIAGGLIEIEANRGAGGSVAFAGL
jgi:hypothetical protein